MAGAAVSLTYAMPQTNRQVIRRIVVSCLSGAVLAAIVRDRLSLPQNDEGLMCGAFLAAVGAWAALAVLHKFIAKQGE